MKSKMTYNLRPPLSVDMLGDKWKESRGIKRYEKKGKKGVLVCLGCRPTGFISPTGP